ncbi:MAG: transcription-repair coupling factor [Bacteroidia bacterium]|nr:transcription-repair coupling factor [Bacteroidia bacterium]
MDLSAVKELFGSHPKTAEILKAAGDSFFKIGLKGLTGSSPAFLVHSLFPHLRRTLIVVIPDREEAAYFMNDLANLGSTVFWFPPSFRKPYEIEETANANVIHRAEVLEKISHSAQPVLVVTTPEGLAEKVIRRQELSRNTLTIKKGEKLSVEFVSQALNEYGFQRVDYVTEPGTYSLRGGITDIWSFSSDLPLRVEFFGDEAESLRYFDPVDQLSRKELQEASIIPNISAVEGRETRQSFREFLGTGALFYVKDQTLCLDLIKKQFEQAMACYPEAGPLLKKFKPEDLYCDPDTIRKEWEALAGFRTGITGEKPTHTISFVQRPQPSFAKNFDLLQENLEKNLRGGFQNIICADAARQVERLYAIFDDLLAKKKKISAPGKDQLGQLSSHLFTPVLLSVHEGFIDEDLRRAVYTDHQLFDRYHRFRIRNNSYKKNEALTLKELKGLNPGDYIVHIDHGIGRFGGLEKVMVNGKEQETIRIVYKDHDVLNISIHALHRISKYAGKDGAVPRLDKLGSQAWSNLKNKTKKKVKEIAFDLIKLYARRKAEKGFAFAPDNYLQNELEASFIYEDTPDQYKATRDVKKDMEAEWPMDRLVCGDVGFGKTEIAVRAAFKAVNDGKQVAILVPTTILALQHFKTFSERLAAFPVKVDYLSRFRSAGEQKQVLRDLAEKKTDILIGTHKLIGKEVKFKDLGLLVIDEEQKFGVAAKDKLKTLRHNVDTLTLTATPIPRTLQFSMLGARDLSIIHTPPPNRYPIQTEVQLYNEEIIRDAIRYEVERGGQVFFVHNRVGNLRELAGMLHKLLPSLKIAIGHGQMDGKELEEVMVNFIEGQYDVLLSTTIIESGLDIPNANTIIINDAHLFGLSDLHQMRGRVGRSNKKAFCYLLTPPFSTLTDEARKRLKAIEQFSDLGSGFNIAMRDLDIRGAGDLLGAEQSGFITDIGYETYMKILEEAMEELKSEGTSAAAPLPSSAPVSFVKDCQLDTDLELLIPDAYVDHISERIYLYKELDNCKTDEELEHFSRGLKDRFGTLPVQTAELIRAVKLRRLAQESGFEKLFLKNKRMTGYFISKQESPFYSSETFRKILEHMKIHPKGVRMKEGQGKLMLIFDPIRNVEEAITAMEQLGR